ncbi:MAG: hypothetical protein JJ895_07125 [Balneolaceae bacterium]|nr:hypothetical protein [Balneolaceae bacterium]
MKTQIRSVGQVSALIKAGKTLLIAGDEKLIKLLPKGDWIAGTIPYFMDYKGGTFSESELFITELPRFITATKHQVYNNENIHRVYGDAFNHGFSIIIMPSGSDIHSAFALNCGKYHGFANKPLVGWVSGINLDKAEYTTPKVFDGKTGDELTDEAVVIHASLPTNKIAYVDIINIFEQGDTDELTFPVDGFLTKDVIVNGKRKKFAKYLESNKISLKQPLVTDSFGTIFNTSFQKIENNKVYFYAPVFSNTVYKIAKPIKDYVFEFFKQIPIGVSRKVVFSCNCILNYLYAELEGRPTFGFAGPVTFGEIGYRLLNQTMVYLTIEDID